MHTAIEDREAKTKAIQYKILTMKSEGRKTVVPTIPRIFTVCIFLSLIITLCAGGRTNNAD